MTTASKSIPRLSPWLLCVPHPALPEPGEGMRTQSAPSLPLTLRTNIVSCTAQPSSDSYSDPSWTEFTEHAPARQRPLSGFILLLPLPGTFKSCREFPSATAGEKLFLPAPWGRGAKLAALPSWKKKQPSEQMAGSKEWCWKRSFKAIQSKNHNSTRLSREPPDSRKIHSILANRIPIPRKENNNGKNVTVLLFKVKVRQCRLVLGYHQQRCNGKRQVQYRCIFPLLPGYQQQQPAWPSAVIQNSQLRKNRSVHSDHKGNRFCHRTEAAHSPCWPQLTPDYIICHTVSTANTPLLLIDPKLISSIPVYLEI